MQCSLSRRQPSCLRLGAPTVLLALVATACGTGDGSSAASSAGAEQTPAASGPWRYTDDVGTTVELDGTPQRIVMYEDVAASLMDFGIRPAGIAYGYGGPERSAVLEGQDLAGVANVGATCGVGNLEAAAAARPDLFVFMHWGGKPEEVFCVEDVEDLRRIAPVVLVEAEGSADDNLASYAELAGALGADLGAEDLVAKRERYEQAVADLTTALAERPEITLLPFSATGEVGYVAEPGGFADLQWLQEDLGVTFEGPFSGPFTEKYWEQLSAENVTQYRGDVVLLDSREPNALAAAKEAFPLWERLPEVRADQVVAWGVPGSFSYTRTADFLESLSAAVEDADDLVG